MRRHDCAGCQSHLFAFPRHENYSAVSFNIFGALKSCFKVGLKRTRHIPAVWLQTNSTFTILFI